MENERLLRTSMDDIVFDGRNKSYGAFQLRRLYDKHMTRAMLVGMLFFLLVVGSPQIISMIKGFLPDTSEELKNTEVILAEPPPLDPNKPPPPPPPRVIPPPLKDQIRFVPPVVKKDDEVIIEDTPPDKDTIAEKEIANVTMKGDSVHGEEPAYEEPTPVVIEEPVSEEPFTYVEQMPTFPDGTEAMYKYIYQQIKYPAIARENGISGQVIVQFVVTKDGDIQKAKVVRGISGGCNEEALRVVNGMPRWKPGKHNGRAVPVTFTLPIKFVLQ
ncbi:MAG TPA: TonB family protein [Saprospiraceae bacterium]|nr:TonB family protein [Saprospiraceae bacterium]